MRILKLVGQKLLSYLTTKFLSLMYREIRKEEKRKVSTIRLWELKGQSEKERGSLVRLQYTSILLALEGGM